MTIKSIKNALSRSLINAIGWRTSRKIIVIESDDWGSIRMPNKETKEAFEELGYSLNGNPYCQYDTLANSIDLLRLFQVLQKYRDKNGNHPALTANTVVSNPDFDKIKKSEFNEYHFRPFIETLKFYYPNEDIFSLWQEGIDKNIFVPQYHGKEHLNVPLWLENLKNGHKAFLDAFEKGFWGLPKHLYKRENLNIQVAYGSSKPEHLAYYKRSIIEGLNLFEQIFGYRSKTFIANNYTWSPILNKTIKDCGILAFQGMKFQKIPKIEGGIKFIPSFTGKINEFGQLYTVRNSFFEPSQMPTSFKNVENCLKEIKNAFLFKKPAIITSHRLNYIGSIYPENRERNLILLDNLLKSILKKWPDVEFMTSDKLVKYILHNDG